MGTIDKSTWPRGPWDGEPDRETFVTAPGLPAVVNRVSHSGALCGYVAVPVGHPWHGKDYSAIVVPTKAQLERPVNLDNVSVISLLCATASSDNPADGARIDCLVEVHGGLTYAASAANLLGEQSEEWYFGFDCAHYGDLTPAMHQYGLDGTYRDIEFVRFHINRLAAQLIEVAQ